MVTIEDIIKEIEAEIIKMETKNYLNVVSRIDEAVEFLKDLLAKAKGEQEAQKFDLVQTLSDKCTVAYSVGGEAVSAGPNVLTYGDELTITVSTSTGYKVDTFTINGQNAVSGSTITVTTDLAIVVTTTPITYNLTETKDEHCAIAYSVDDETINPGADVISYGDSLVITVTADEGYEISTFTVNGQTGTSGSAITVTGNVAVVVATTEATPAPEAPE